MKKSLRRKRDNDPRILVNTTGRRCYQKSYLVIFGAIYCVLVKGVDGYAAWTKCYVNFTDHREALMGAPLLLPESQANEIHKQVQIEINFDGGDDAGEWTTSDATYPVDKVSTIHARLKAPSQLQEKDQLQYAIDIISDGCSTSGEACSTKFVHPSKCEGKRADAIGFDTIVEFQIDGTHSTNPVQLVAAWALGHEQVKITRTITFRRDEAESHEQVPSRVLVTDALYYIVMFGILYIGLSFAMRFKRRKKEREV